MAHSKRIQPLSQVERVLSAFVLLGAVTLGGCEAGSQVAVRGASGATSAETQCIEEGAACGSGTCCEGLACCGGKCSDPTSCVRAPDCKVVEVSCNTNAECCSGACAATGLSQGTKICQGVDGCRPLGESCSTTGECCSGTCAVSSGSLKCVLTTENALAPGELCGKLAKFGLSCKLDAMGNSPCVRSRIGVERCRAFEPNTPCKQVGLDCSTALECCRLKAPDGSGQEIPGSNECLPNPDTGEAQCSNLCANIGLGCRSSTDCCAPPPQGLPPLVCKGGTCTPSNDVCRELGNECDSGAQCCSGFCAPGEPPPNGGTGVIPWMICAAPPDPPR